MFKPIIQATLLAGTLGFMLCASLPVFQLYQASLQQNHAAVDLLKSHWQSRSQLSPRLVDLAVQRAFDRFVQQAVYNDLNKDLTYRRAQLNSMIDWELRQIDQ